MKSRTVVLRWRVPCLRRAEVAPGPTWPYVFGASCLLLAVVPVWVWIKQRPNPPVNCFVRGRDLVMLDSHDRPLWQFTLPSVPIAAIYKDPRDRERMVHIADIDGDGRP